MEDDLQYGERADYPPNCSLKTHTVEPHQGNTFIQFGPHLHHFIPIIDEGFNRTVVSISKVAPCKNRMG